MLVAVFARLAAFVRVAVGLAVFMRSLGLAVSMRLSMFLPLAMLSFAGFMPLALFRFAGFMPLCLGSFDLAVFVRLAELGPVAGF